jgi:hypothetical protein
MAKLLLYRRSTAVAQPQAAAATTTELLCTVYFNSSNCPQFWLITNPVKAKIITRTTLMNKETTMAGRLELNIGVGQYSQSRGVSILQRQCQGEKMGEEMERKVVRGDGHF